MLFAFLAVGPMSGVIVIAVALIGLLIWGAWKPLIWRLFSVLGIGAGGGFLVWGIMMAALKESPPFASPVGSLVLVPGS